MGRSSMKPKDKKVKKNHQRQEKKEENARINDKIAKVQNANALADPLESLQAFKKFERNGQSLTISCEHVANISPEVIEWGLQLTKDNMLTLYEESDWGWNDRQKKEEMTEEAARYLIVRRNQDNKPVAMVHFRFDMDYDDEVLYCYEIQLEKEVRRKGLGKFLMQILELLAHKMEMSKLMLTAFNKNQSAQSFFKDTLKFEVDETSPEETMVEAMFDEEGYSYEILSKKIVPRAPKVLKAKPNGSENTMPTQNGHSVASSS